MPKDTSGSSEAIAPTSPLSGGGADLVRAVRLSDIQLAYMREHDFDVAPHLPRLSELQLMRCRDTGLEFFTPVGLSGSPAFYDQLYGRRDRTGEATKWEFDVAAEIITASNARRTLDVGCGEGHFLKLLRETLPLASVEGLETARNARATASDAGFAVSADTIEAHAESHFETYDAITAFQVIEHVDDPASFINACTKALSPGGVLILTTPDNDSFIRHRPFALNLPPHHVSWWSTKTYEALPRLFDIDLLRIEREPLQRKNTGWYRSVMEDRYLLDNRKVRALYYRLGLWRLAALFIVLRRRSLFGQTIVAAFRKRRSS